MQAYSNPKREDDVHALPDVEVFYLHAGPRKAYDRAYVMDYCDHDGGDGSHGPQCEDCPESGWYWWSCFPGCLPDGDPNGPFDTEDKARIDAQSGMDDDDLDDEAAEAAAILKQDAETVPPIVEVVGRLVGEALAYEAEAFDGDEDVNGGNLVEWFADWRKRMKAEIERYAISL
jgi:hypothetical protein